MNNIISWLRRNKYFTGALCVAIIMFTVICVLLVNSKKDDSTQTTETYVMGESKDTEETTSTDETSSDKTTAPTETTDDKFNDTTIAEGNQDGQSDETTSPEEATAKPSDYPYLVKVNRVMNCVTVYTKDDKGEFTVPYVAFTCSTGKNVGDTPLGTFTTSGKYEWCLMVDGTYGQYAYRIDGPIMFHSVPSYRQSKDSLETDQYNKLGEVASLGCIRLSVKDAKWLFDNCPSGTTVVIYDDTSSPGPLGKPATIKIPANHAYSGWDPFDPDEANPWNTMTPSIKGARNKTIKAGSSINLTKGVTATDSCLNDITSSIKIDGNVNTNKAGKYTITYSVTDLLGRTADKTITITVKGSSEATTSKPKETTTSKPKETTTSKPKETTTSKPKETTTSKPKETTTKPKETTTKATETTVPDTESTVNPEETTEAP